MSAQILPWPKPLRINPGSRVTRLAAARVVMESCEFFRRCETAARDAIDAGDIVEAMHQLITLASFEISDQAPPHLEPQRRGLLLELIDYATGPATRAPNPHAD